MELGSLVAPEEIAKPLFRKGDGKAWGELSRGRVGLLMREKSSDVLDFTVSFLSSLKLEDSYGIVDESCKTPGEVICTVEGSSYVGMDIRLVERMQEVQQRPYTIYGINVDGGIGAFMFLFFKYTSDDIGDQVVKFSSRPVMLWEAREGPLCKIMGIIRGMICSVKPLPNATLADRVELLPAPDFGSDGSEAETE